MSYINLSRGAVANVRATITALGLETALAGLLDAWTDIEKLAVPATPDVTGRIVDLIEQGRDPWADKTVQTAAAARAHSAAAVDALEQRRDTLYADAAREHSDTFHRALGKTVTALQPAIEAGRRLANPRAMLDGTAGAVAPTEVAAWRESAAAVDKLARIVKAWVALNSQLTGAIASPGPSTPLILASLTVAGLEESARRHPAALGCLTMAGVDLDLADPDDFRARLERVKVGRQEQDERNAERSRRSLAGNLRPQDVGTGVVGWVA